MRQEPVLTAGAIAGVVMAGLTMAVGLGWLRLDDAQMGSIQTFLVAALGLIVPVAAALWARGQVTPTANPKTADGEPAVLMPASQVTPEMLLNLGQEGRQWPE